MSEVSHSLGSWVLPLKSDDALWVFWNAATKTVGICMYEMNALTYLRKCSQGSTEVAQGFWYSLGASSQSFSRVVERQRGQNAAIASSWGALLVALIELIFQFFAAVLRFICILTWLEYVFVERKWYGFIVRTHGFVEKVNVLNAAAACDHPNQQSHLFLFWIWKTRETVTEKWGEGSCVWWSEKPIFLFL